VLDLKCILCSGSEDSAGHVIDSEEVIVSEAEEARWTCIEYVEPFRKEGEERGREGHGPWLLAICLSEKMCERDEARWTCAEDIRVFWKEEETRRDMSQRHPPFWKEERREEGEKHEPDVVEFRISWKENDVGDGRRE
jgi:hypothetical protein